MNVLQVHRLTLALTYLLEYVPPEHPDEDIDFNYQMALKNAKVVLSCFAPINWMPDDEGTCIDEQSMTSNGFCDIYINGIWQIDLIGKIEAQAILSEED